MTESEDHLRSAIDAAELGIRHWNRTVGRITYVGHVRRVFGCEPADLPDTPHALLDLVHADNRDLGDRELIISEVVHRTLRLGVGGVRADGPAGGWGG